MNPSVCPKCRTWFEGTRCPACGFSTSHRAGLRAVLVVLTTLCLSGLLFALDTGERTPLLSYPAIALLVLGAFGAFFVLAQLMMGHPSGAREPTATRDSVEDAVIYASGFEAPDGFDAGGDGGGGGGGGD